MQFIIKRDPEGKFRFASLQSESGQQLLSECGLLSGDFDSFVFIQDKRFYVKSTAAFRVMKELGSFWKLLYVFIFLPAPFRDYFYSLIAKSRYRMFGKKESCMIPTPELKIRFLP